MENKTVAELRQILERFGYSEEAKTMGKKEMKDLVDSIESSQALLDSVKQEAKTESDRVKEIPEAPEEKPSISDPEWTDYVLSLFTQSELDNGNPKVDGLRRVAHKVLGPFNIETRVIQAPSVDNAGRATVEVHLEFPDPYGLAFRCSGAADVFTGNTHKTFAVHAVATAETRAEGRALRRALRLTKVLSAEETYNANPDEPNGEDERVIDGMVNSLNQMANAVGIDARKTALKMGYDVESLKDLTQKQARLVAEQIVKYRRGDEVIPDEIRA